jgi:hypothetical protein
MIKNMSFKNSFEQSAKEYLGLQGGVSAGKPTTVFTSGILEVDGASGRKVQMGADSSNSAYLDFKSRDGGLADYDSRIISQFGSTGSTAGEGVLSVQADVLQVLTTEGMRVGSITAPSFKLDYGAVNMGGSLNSQVPVVFTVGLFATNPYVFLTIVSPITNEANAQPVFVESLTTAGFNAQYIGTPNSTGAGTLCNWLAIGV